METFDEDSLRSSPEQRHAEHDGNRYVEGDAGQGRSGAAPSARADVPPRGTFDLSALPRGPYSLRLAAPRLVLNLGASRIMPTAIPTATSAAPAAPSDRTGGAPLPPVMEAIQRDYVALLRSEAARRWIGAAYGLRRAETARLEMPAEIIAAARLAREMEALVGMMSDEANQALTGNSERMVKKRITG